jgi:drug/metabolite transporter (DMT)-like permease
MISLEKTSNASRLYLLLISLILTWGLSWPIAKIGLQYMSPLWFAAARMIIATLTMFTIVGLLKKLSLPRKEDLKLIFIIGILQIAVFIILITVGLSYVEAGRSSVLVFTTPLWVVPISILFFKEESTPTKWLGFIFGIIGIFILLNPSEINWSDKNTLVGNMMLLAAAFCWAIVILCTRHMKWSRTPLELICWQLLLGTILVVSFVFVKQPHAEITWNSTLILSLLYNGALSSALGSWAIVIISKEFSPITTSLSLLAIPVVGVITSTILLHEHIALSMLIAMTCIISGLLCIIIKPKKFILKEAN